jgi:hypothetical protein
MVRNAAALDVVMVVRVFDDGGWDYDDEKTRSRWKTEVTWQIPHQYRRIIPVLGVEMKKMMPNFYNS